MAATPGKRYRHYKGGEYTVLAIARLESDPSIECAVYQAEYDTDDYGRKPIWIRALSEFEGEVITGGSVQKRFTLI